MQIKIDVVEETLIKLLKAGKNLQEISQIMGLDPVPIVAGLSYKGVLYPDGRFKITSL